MADFNSKIIFFLKNAPIKEANKLKEILERVDSFANDVRSIFVARETENLPDM